MARLDANDAECSVFTYKEGLLSAVAHDLELKVGSFVIEIDEGAKAIDARFDARSLRVVRAVGGTVSEKDKRTIEKTIVDDVLHATKYPEVRFRSTKVDGARIEGTLAIHGREKTISFEVREEGGRRVVQVRLHQPDFGIKPYTAMLGTLRIQADIDVKISLPGSA